MQFETLGFIDICDWLCIQILFNINLQICDGSKKKVLKGLFREVILKNPL